MTVNALIVQAGIRSFQGVQTAHAADHEAWLCREEGGGATRVPAAPPRCLWHASRGGAWCHLHPAADGALLTFLIVQTIKLLNKQASCPAPKVCSMQRRLYVE